MADETQAETEAPSEPPKTRMLLPTLAAILVGIGAGGATGSLVAGPMLAKRVVPPLDTASLAKEIASGDGPKAHGAPGEAGKGEGGKGEGGVEASLYSIDNIVMNPSGSNGQRFLLLSITFDLKDAATVAAMKARDAEVRDVVQHTVGLRTIDQLGNLSLRDTLKADVVAATERVIGAAAVRKVFFPQFVIQ